MKTRKDLAAEFLGSGLGGRSGSGAAAQPVVRRDKKTGLPVIQCRRCPSRSQRLTAGQVARILARQEAEWGG